METPTIDWRARALAAEACAFDLETALLTATQYIPPRLLEMRTVNWKVLQRWQLHQADYDTLDAAQADAAPRAVNSDR